MKILLLTVGKSERGYVQDGVQVFTKKIVHYLPFTILDISAGNHSNRKKALEEEGSRILKHVKPQDQLVLLDHTGKTYSSESFSKLIEQKMTHVNGNLIFAIGGPFGFSDEVYKKASLNLSLSSMIFSHQIIRIIFLEQLYRALTIIRNEPYHHS